MPMQVAPKVGMPVPGPASPPCLSNCFGQIYPVSSEHNLMLRPPPRTASTIKHSCVTLPFPVTSSTTSDRLKHSSADGLVFSARFPTLPRLQKGYFLLSPQKAAKPPPFLSFTPPAP
uniref:Uncharacterized protein n=1 Tax=Dunaliella tertiolecta TaxID=3047 RepID=A0A6S8JGC1_DUNTE